MANMSYSQYFLNYFIGLGLRELQSIFLTYFNGHGFLIKDYIRDSTLNGPLVNPTFTVATVRGIKWKPKRQKKRE